MLNWKCLQSFMEESYIWKLVLLFVCSENKNGLSLCVSYLNNKRRFSCILHIEFSQRKYRRRQKTESRTMVWPDNALLTKRYERGASSRLIWTNAPENWAFSSAMQIIITIILKAFQIQLLFYRTIRLELSYCCSFWFMLVKFLLINLITWSKHLSLY